LNITHIQIAINRAFYNHYVLKKFKSEVLKKEILYFLCERSNINLCFELHKLEDQSHDYYILFIDTESEKVNFYIIIDSSY